MLVSFAPAVSGVVSPVAGALASAVVSHPIASALTVLLATSAYWIPRAEAGPAAFATCYAACMASSNVATSGAFAPATHLFCCNFCAPAMAAPTP